MCDSRRTKRERDEWEGMSLDAHIAAHRAALVAAREEAPALRARAAELRARALALGARRHLRRVGLDLAHEASELEAEASARESMVREHDFERTVVRYLKVYHAVQRSEQCATVHDAVRAHTVQREASKVRASTILDEYLTELNRAPAKVAMAVRDECPRCDGTKLLMCASKAIMSCPKCGHAVSYLDATTSSTAFDDVIEFSQYSYKRVNHYVMWLALVQGKEAHRVDDATMRLIMGDLRDRQGLARTADVTQLHVRAAIRHLRLRKAYDHVVQVTSRITGVRPKRVSRDTEERLRTMFLQMQPAFERHAPKVRTNFLSYSYVLYRSFQILGLHDMLDSVTLLKGRDKLEANDAIFLKMCEDLGWSVPDLPPPLEG